MHLWKGGTCLWGRRRHSKCISQGGLVTQLPRLLLNPPGTIPCTTSLPHPTPLPLSVDAASLWSVMYSASLWSVMYSALVMTQFFH